MSKKERIKNFIKDSEKLKDGFDISDVRKYYKRRFDVRPDRSDVVDACIELRKEGVIRNDFESLSMRFCKPVKV